MGEAVISCEGDEALREVEGSDACEGSTVRWERLLPRVALRVLLVEADDSTRQVIAALLRKCSYEVAAVSDGLKAWEMLKGRPNCIDLILTEVDLPSISGFALLTLIMEHDHCKNIPVIMMSSNDSVNMVYKCMLRGAADFLVKPVRKNELQNLWQHVWRRQSQGAPDESITQRKAEGLSDSDLPINLSNGACTPQNEECAEKGNDAQSSCSVPDLEAESACTENMQRNSKSKLNKLVTLNAEFDEEECVRGDSAALKPARVVKGSSLEATEDAVMIIQQEDPGGKRIGGDDNTTAEASDNNDAFINGSGEARDLIGTFQNHTTKSCVNSSVITGATQYDSCPHLDLSLRRSDDFQSHQNTTVDERRHTVHQSNVSAFSRYRAVQIQPAHQAQASDYYHRPREYEASSDKRLLSSPVQPSNPDAQKSSAYQASGELRQGEHPFSCPQPRILPVTVPVKGVRLDRTCTSYGSSLHPSFYNQAGASPTPSPDSAGQKEVFSRVMQVADPNASSCSNQTMLRQEMNLDTMEHVRNVASGNERSQNSGLCNGDMTRLNSYGGGSACGSNGSGNPTAERKAEGIPAADESGNRSLQREAALTKFRQKRKDRCFEKKVRYESRKKLAEQRPRVKGQFVRQVPTDISTSTTAET